MTATTYTKQIGASSARRVLRGMTLALGFFAAAHGSAQTTYPTKPIRILVPFAAGGSTDLLARGIGERLTGTWSKPVVIDNRPGADGIVASQIVATAEPDGYTLLMVAIGHASNASLYKLPYDTLRDFRAVILAADVPMVLVVRSGLKANSVSELVELARHKPGLNCASAGVGASHHLAAELFRLAAKVELQHIQYKGASPALLDVAAGRADMMFAPMLVSMPHVKAGRMKALAVTSPQRVSIAPDLPTIAESGVRGYEARAWYGLVAPARVPKEIVVKLNAQIDEGLRSSAFREKLLTLGAVPVGGSAEEFATFIEQEVKKYAEVVKQGGIRSEQ
ncbi:MAG: tripartite tricarboxylate transporter substrate binding protein [Rhodospirillaceae bacterium]